MKADNKLLFECYIKSEPESRGYRKRLVALWRRCGAREDLKDVSEQRLADQVRQKKSKMWLEKLVQDEISARVKGEQCGGGNDVHQQPLVEQSGTVNGEKGNGYVMDGSRGDRRREEERVGVGEDAVVCDEVRALRDRLLEVMKQDTRAMLPSLNRSHWLIRSTRLFNTNNKRN